MVKTRSQAGKALKAPKRLIEETLITKPATKTSTTKRSAVKKSAKKKSAATKTATKKSTTNKNSAATKRKAFEDAVGPEKKRPTKRVPAAILYEVTDKYGKKRTKHLEFPSEELDQFNCPCEPDKFDSKGMKEFLHKKMEEHGIDLASTAKPRRHDSSRRK